MHGLNTHLNLIALSLWWEETNYLETQGKYDAHVTSLPSSGITQPNREDEQLAEQQLITLIRIGPWPQEL